MKLHLSMLEKLIELPTKNPGELRHVLDDLGLEVKEIQEEGTRVVYNIETLANRGDHLYALGVARELSARYLTSLNYPQVSPDFSGLRGSLPVRKNTDLCMRYALLEMSLPMGLKLRPEIILAMSEGGTSERPPIVDLLNYVQLEFGQPMHAFDQDKVEGEIIIELSAKEEKVEALDGNTYNVPPGSILIKDRKKIIAVGGVIGCANSMVSSSTKKVLIESASFDPVCIRKTARGMGSSTEASYVFERGCDLESVRSALRRVVFLASGSGGVVQDAASPHILGISYVEGGLVEKRKVVLRLIELRKQLHLPRLNDVEVSSRLKHLGFGLEQSSNSGELLLNVPSWRLWDIYHEQDLVEEVCRSQGFSRVKETLPPLVCNALPPNPSEAFLYKVEKSLVGLGFYEVMTQSFYSAEDVRLLEKLDNGIGKRHVTTKNAVEGTHSHLKLTNILHMARLVEQNLKKEVLSCKVYEFSRLFGMERENKSSYEFEREVLSLAVAGRWYEQEWKKGETTSELLFLFKGALESLFRSLGQKITVTEANEQLLHPGMQGGLKVGRTLCGFFGVLHPYLMDVLELPSSLVYAQIEVEKILKLSIPEKIVHISEFPPIRRDITLKIKERELASKVARIIEDLEKINLKEITLVDDFKKSEEDFRRLTVRLTFQTRERTLAHTEIDTLMHEILSELKNKHSLELA